MLSGNPESRLARMLEMAGAQLARHGKHIVYRLPNGKSLTVASTPRDKRRNALNSIRDLRRLMD